MNVSVHKNRDPTHPRRGVKPLVSVHGMPVGISRKANFGFVLGLITLFSTLVLVANGIIPGGVFVVVGFIVVIASGVYAKRLRRPRCGKATAETFDTTVR